MNEQERIDINIKVLHILQTGLQSFHCQQGLQSMSERITDIFTEAESKSSPDGEMNADKDVWNVDHAICPHCRLEFFFCAYHDDQLDEQKLKPCGACLECSNVDYSDLLDKNEELKIETLDGNVEEVDCPKCKNRFMYIVYGEPTYCCTKELAPDTAEYEKDGE